MLELIIIIAVLIPIAVFAIIVWLIVMAGKERRLTKKLIKLEAEDMARIRAEELESYRNQTPPPGPPYRHDW